MMRVGLSVEEAIQEILQHVVPVAVIEIPLKDSFQYILAEDVYALSPVPPFDRSMMDGFAIRAADVEHASPEHPVILRVKGRVAAGEVFEYKLRPGEAIRIMTGAATPDGADAIVRFEMTDGQKCPEAKEVAVLLPVQPADCISVTGEDIQTGDKVLAKGTLLGAAEMALLATVGISMVPVHRKPIIGVISSGKELVAQDQPLPHGKIYNSNTFMVSGLISKWGGIPYLFDHVDDDLDQVIQAIREAMPVVDALVTTGGVSVGDFDVMRSAYHLAGGQVNFWKVNIRPGTPFTFAVVLDKPVFGLSGNPGAGFVNALLFLQPAIRCLAGYPHPAVEPVKLQLGSEPGMKVIGLDRFLRANIVIQDGRAIAYPLPAARSAGVLSTLTGIEGFIRIPGKTEVNKGDLVEAWMLQMPFAGESS
jgi:molybdopterin molybdotransferase